MATPTLICGAECRVSVFTPPSGGIRGHFAGASGTIAVETTIIDPFGGSASWKLSGNSTYITLPISSASDTFVARIRFYLPTGSTYALIASNSGAAGAAWVATNGDGTGTLRINVTDAGISVGSGVAAATVTEGAWHTLDYYHRSTGGTDTVKVKLDYGVEVQATYAIASDVISICYLGDALSVAAGAAIAYFDNMMFSETAADYPIGPGKVLGYSVGTTSGTHAQTAGDLKNNSAANITNADSSGGLVDELPANTSDYVAQVVIRTTSYWEGIYATSGATETPRGVEQVESFFMASAASGSHKAQLYDGTTATDMFATTPFSNTGIINAAKCWPAAPSGAWTNAKLKTTRIRWGFSGDVTPNPRFSSTILEVESVVTVYPQFVGAIGAIATAEALGTLTASAPQPLTAVGAIASAEALGTPVTLNTTILTAVGAIASGEAIGTPAWTGAFTVTAVGAIASAEAVGTPTLAPGVVSVTAVGAIASAEAFGTPSYTTVFTVSAVGAIASGEAVGTPSYIFPGFSVSAVGAIASAEAVGNPTATPGVVTITAVGAIASAQAVGTPAWTTAQVLENVGAIATGQALGNPTLAPGVVTVTAVGAIASGEAVGTPSYALGAVTLTNVGAIASGEGVGTPTWTGLFSVTAVGGIASGEAVGTPAWTTPPFVLTAVGGIATAQAVGTPTYIVGGVSVTAVGAIASSEALGTPVLAPGTVTLTNVGAIATGQALGTPAWAGLNSLTLVGIVSAEAFGALKVFPKLYIDLISIASGEAFGFLTVFHVWPARRMHLLQYHAIVYSPDASGGPGTPKLELDPDMLNLVWKQRQNEAGQAAFAMYRHNPKLDQITWMVDHIKIIRESPAGTVTVFAGKLVKPLWSGQDVLCYCWDYNAFLQLSRTGYKTAYATKLVGTEIVSPEWTVAKAMVNSPFTFVTTGTIQNPLGLDGVTPIKTNAKFGVVDFDRLFTFSMLAEMSMANTANNVKFEITREAPHTFNFWKDFGSNKTGFVAVDPGNLAAYSFDGGRDAIRHDLATVLSDGLGGHAEYFVVSADASTTNLRRLQGALPIRTLFGTTAGATETDQGKAALARQLVVSTRYPREVVIQPRQGEFNPFIDADTGDKIRHILQRADRTGDLYDGYLRLVEIDGAWDRRHGELITLISRGTP